MLHLCPFLHLGTFCSILHVLQLYVVRCYICTVYLMLYNNIYSLWLETKWTEATRDVPPGREDNDHSTTSVWSYTHKTD